MILAVHRQEPNWPAAADRPRFAIEHGGRTYWAETDGDAPTAEDVAVIIEPNINDAKAAYMAMTARDAAAVTGTRSDLIAVHMEKFAQATAVLAMGQEAANAMRADEVASDFPFLAASLRGSDLWTCANTVARKYTEDTRRAAAVEGVRLAANDAIRSAVTVRGVREAYETIVWPTP